MLKTPEKVAHKQFAIQLLGDCNERERRKSDRCCGRRSLYETIDLKAEFLLILMPVRSFSHLIDRLKAVNNPLGLRNHFRGFR